MGYFSLAFQIYIILGSIVAQFGLASIPRLSRANEHQRQSASIFLEHVFGFGWILASTLTIGAISIGSFAVELLFGTEYKAVSSLLPWSAFMVGVFFWTSSLRGILTAHHQQILLLLSTLLGAVVFTLAFPWFIQYWGMLGAFIATLAGLLTVTIIQGFILWHREPFPIIRPIIIPGLLGLGSIILSQSLADNPFISLTISLAVLLFGSLILKVPPIYTIFQKIRTYR